MKESKQPLVITIFRQNLCQSVERVSQGCGDLNRRNASTYQSAKEGEDEG